MLFIEMKSLEGGPVQIWLMNNHIVSISFTLVIQLLVKICGASYNLLLISILILSPLFFSNVLFHFPCDVLFAFFF